MNSILWYQHPDLNVGDVIFCNGTRVDNKSQAMHCFDQTKKTADLVINKRTPWCGKVSGYFFMKGYLKSRDEINRKMSFMYITDENNYRDACEAELKAACLEMSDDTQKCLMRPSRQPWKIYAFFVLVIVLIMAIIISITKSNCENKPNKDNEVIESVDSYEYETTGIDNR